MNLAALHPKIRELIEFAPSFRKILTSDPVISFSDCEKVVYFLGSQVLPLDDSTGYVLTNKDPMYEVIHHNKIVDTQMAKEAYGYAFRTVIVPIKDDSKRVVGTMAVTSSLDNQEELIDVAEQLAASSEQISASTTEMDTSAKELMDLMSHLTEAQYEMKNQMTETEKILSFINSIAKSSRILGLNAGIEAARSGEHGKGFSVVAKEITKLADQSADSVNQIKKLFDSIEIKVQEITTAIENTFEISKNQSTATNEISQAINHLASAAENVKELAKKI